MENRVSALEKKIAGILDRLANLGNMGGGVAMDDGRLANLEQRVKALEDAFENLKNDIARWMKDL